MINGKVVRKGFYMIDELRELIKNNNGKIGYYGVEREMLRVDRRGILSKKAHPNKLGNKFQNQYITTDFSESQVEIITPPFSDLNKTYDFVNFLYDTVAVNIDDEYLWPNSMPCEIEGEIPVAEFGDQQDAKSATKYREKLLKKYGGKKQLISGIHLNFSFDEYIIKGLYEKFGRNSSYRDFKDSIYLKVARNYLRYRWLIVYLICNTTTVHKTYIDACKCSKCFKEVAMDSYSHQGGISYRNGECGYRNLVDIFPDYSSVSGYIDSLEKLISEGVIESHKELYSQIRLKPQDPYKFINSLKADGIKYLEYRTIDINPFERGGVALIDMKFLEMFNLFLITKDESEYEMWQEEALHNQDKVAKFGKDNIDLKKDGILIDKSKWALEILNEAEEVASKIGLDTSEIFDEMRERVRDIKNTYAYKTEERVTKMGYINAFLSLAYEYKSQAQNFQQSEKEYFSLKIDSVNELRSAVIAGEKIRKIY